MDKKILVGYEFFDEFIRNNGYYVDKTELIYELAARNTNQVTLFTRPRRFGKTLTMTMMESFLDVRRNSRDVFEKLDIQKNHPDFCNKWMNQYPVIFLTLKDVEGLNFDDAYDMLKNLISSLCIRYSYLLGEEHVKQINSTDRDTFSKLMNKSASLAEIKNSLLIMMRMMKAVYGKPVIVLIDEYDVPLAKAAESKNRSYYRQMLDVIRGILSISLKSNEYLKFAVLTGCLRISKESIFTGVNNFACYSVSDRKFSRTFGFTKEEVSDMLNAFGMPQKMETVSKCVMSNQVP